MNMDTPTADRTARPVAYRLRRRPGGRKSFGGPRGAAGPRKLPPRNRNISPNNDGGPMSLGRASDFAVASLINDTGSSSSSPSPTRRSPLVLRAPRRVSSVEAELHSPRHHRLGPRKPSLTSRRSMPMLKTQVKEEAEEDKKNFQWKEKKPRSRVSFEKAAFNQVEKLELSEEEKQEIWYNEKELHKLRKSVKKLVRKGEKKLDKTQDCWRGLESYVKQLGGSEETTSSCMDESSSEVSVNPDEVEECNKIILMLQKEKELKMKAGSGSNNSRNDLQVRAQNVLRKAMREGTDQAAKDAEEAHAIYMETMDQEQVQSCFRSTSMPNCPPRAA